MQTKTMDKSLVDIVMDKAKVYLACSRNNHVYEQIAEKRPFGAVEYIDTIDLSEFGLTIDDVPNVLKQYKVMQCYSPPDKLCPHCYLNGR
jgi:hypothetical protein